MSQASFDDYQVKYESFPFLPERLHDGIDHLRNGVHVLFSAIEEIYQQGPDVVMKTMQVSVAILSCIPSLEPFIMAPKQFCKEAKNFTDVIKNLKSIDGLLNFFQLPPTLIILNLSGTLLFILSSITIIDRFKLGDVSTIKMRLASIPIFGVLPYGGLLALSVIGLMAPVILLSLEKKRKLEKEESRIKNEKLAFWSTDLDQAKVTKKKRLVKAKLEKFRQEVKSIAQLIKAGKSAEKKYDPINQAHKIKACQKAIQELILQLKDKQAKVAQYKKKNSQWEAIRKKWAQIDRQELEAFRKAKENKWQVRLNKLEREKNMNLITIAGSIAVLSRQFLAVGGAMTGYGPLAFPLLFNSGLEVVISGGGIANFFLKRAIKKIKAPSVDLADYPSI